MILNKIQKNYQDYPVETTVFCLLKHNFSLDPFCGQELKWVFSLSLSLATASETMWEGKQAWELEEKDAGTGWSLLSGRCRLYVSPTAAFKLLPSQHPCSCQASGSIRSHEWIQE